MYMVVRLELVLWTKSHLLTGISCAHSACIPTRIWSSFCLQMSMPLSVLDHQLVGTIVNSLHSASLTRQSVSLVDLSQCQNLKIDELMDTGLCQTLLAVPESKSWLPKIQPSRIIFLPNQPPLRNHVVFYYNIQSSAVITRSNIVRYYINNYRNWSRMSIRCRIHKRHHITRPNGRAMGCLLWIFMRKLTAL